MAYKIKKLIYLATYTFSIITFHSTFLPFQASSLNHQNTFSNTKSEELKSLYLLGEGDVLRIEFQGLGIFSGNYTVGLNSKILLPELDYIDVSGKTIDEFQKELQVAYKDIIFNPEIKVIIIKYRDITFHLAGEVKRPGVYTISNGATISTKNSVDIQNPSIKNLVSDSLAPVGNYRIPRLFNALQIGKGVTTQADLSSIEVRRQNANSQGGGKIMTNINLLQILNDGDNSQNIRIYDGDTIFVKKSNSPIKEQLLSVQKSNLSPEKIGVYVTGNVRRPGFTVLPQGSSLYEAIASAGGRIPLTGNIEFIRFKDNGQTYKRVFSFKNQSSKYSEKNPLLYDGDIINIRLNTLGKATVIIKEIGAPIISSYGLYKIFD